ncbi:hypothetical protein G7Y89_g7787 [Cudoniella acicularis]|uniref:ORC6 first cyclin-like domain-containing protein n=1 Tax=Cudoniella acicularis TaxID=354080 RepID=A0A8H4RHS2_9HELO|nr:hypothetical protein G7Y89_g7787 [Cudoniella acicularis]
MSRPIEQAINNLIPRHPGPPPPELVELARSLLAQSRTKASTLKAEEEIGRTYACANIACERLKTTFNLPPIEVHPPIPPRAYKRLYTHFSSLLLTTSKRQSRNPAPLNRITAKSFNPPSPQPIPSESQKPAPSKATSLDPFRKNRTPKHGLKYKGTKEKDDRVPKWVAPVVRKLCIEMETKEAVPHVLAGVESILCLPTPGSSPTDQNTEITGKDTSGKEFLERNRKVLDVFASVKDDDVLVRKVGEGEGVWRGWEEIITKDVQRWVVEINERDWLELDWFKNINDDDDDAMDINVDDQNPVGTKEAQSVRVGFRMEDEYDFMNPKNKEMVKELQKTIDKLIDDLVEQGVMDIDDSGTSHG